MNICFRRSTTILLFLLCFLFGCEQQYKTVESSEDENEPYIFEFLVQLTDGEGTEVNYDGTEDISVVMQMQNGIEANSIGLAVLIDGVFQECRYNGIPETIFVTSMEPNMRDEVSISFRPSLGKRGDDKSIYFVSILNPEYEINQDNFILFEHNLYVMQTLPWTIHYEVDCGNLEDNSEALSFIDAYASEDNEQSTSFDLFPNEYQKIELDCRTPFTGQLLGRNYADETTYRVCLILNNHIMNVFNGHRYLDVTFKENEELNYPIELGPDMLNNSNTLYVMAVPIGNTAFKSPKIIRTNALAIIVKSNEQVS